MFGAGIMLISQIYHIQGSAKDATWLWPMSTILAAAFTRSIPALALSIALFTTWSWLEPSMLSWRSPEYQFSFAAYMAVCAALAYWMQSRFCAHLVVLATALWAVPTAMALLADGFATFPSALIGSTFLLISIMLFPDRNTNWFRGFECAVVFYAIGVFGVMCFFWSVQPTGLKEPELDVTVIVGIGTALTLLLVVLAFIAKRQNHLNSYDIIVSTVFTALTFICLTVADGEALPFMALLLAASIWVIRMGWRIEYRPITVLGFISFGLMMLWIYFEPIGTLLGTSVFYAVAGVLLLAGVFIVPRLTRTPVNGEVK